MRAREPAMNILSFHEGAKDKTKNEGEEEELKKRHQLLLFLWSVEGGRMSEVSLCEPPDANLFNSLAQEVMKKLNKEETPAEEEPEEEPEEDEKAAAKEKQKSSDESLDDSSKGSSPSPSQSPSSVGRSRHNKDRTQSKKPTHISPNREPLAKFLAQGRDRGRREDRKGRKGRNDPSSSSSNSDSSSGHSTERNERDSNKSSSPRETGEMMEQKDQ
jgi:hypothetical protein